MKTWILKNRYLSLVIVIGITDFIVRGAIRGHYNGSALILVAIATLAANYADNNRISSSND
tara:strand:- start:919 stop:1101 length:183 start_codon:yes stop_codon:yes gene_type:complete